MSTLQLPAGILGGGGTFYKIHLWMVFLGKKLGKLDNSTCFFLGLDVNSMVWKEHPDCTEACGSTVEGATHLSTNLGKD